MSPRPRREERQENLQAAIRETAWKQIGERGAPTLSLRAIARELKITAPAIYNYYPSRDDLVTALIVEAFNSLADSQEQALLNLLGEDHAARLTALGLAYRQWAVTYPQRYLLIFGTPIPGYVAPEEITQPAAARSFRALVGVLQAALEAGVLRTGEPDLEKKLLAQLGEWRKHEPADEHVLYVSLIIWSRVHGLVMIEISGQTPHFLTETGLIFRRQIDAMVATYLRAGSSTAG
jgi:AcrR family transcriptional regulator